METIWDLVNAQPVTNRLYEMNKANQEAAAIENKAVKTTSQIPIVPVADYSQPEGPAYSVTLSQDALSVNVQDAQGTDSDSPDP